MTAKYLRVIAIGVVVLLILWGASERWSRPADTAPRTLPMMPMVMLWAIG